MGDMTDWFGDSPDLDEEDAVAFCPQCKTRMVYIYNGPGEESWFCPNYDCSDYQGEKDDEDWF